MTVTLDAILFSCNLVKAYLFVRVYEQFSKWTSEEADKICKKFKTNASIPFLVKSELKHRPYTMVSVNLQIVILLLGFAVRSYERTYSFNRSEELMTMMVIGMYFGL